MSSPMHEGGSSDRGPSSSGLSSPAASSLSRTWQGKACSILSRRQMYHACGAARCVELSTSRSVNIHVGGCKIRRRRSRRSDSRDGRPGVEHSCCAARRQRPGSSSRIGSHRPPAPRDATDAASAPRRSRPCESAGLGPGLGSGGWISARETCQPRRLRRRL